MILIAAGGQSSERVEGRRAGWMDGCWTAVSEIDEILNTM